MDNDNQKIISQYAQGPSPSNDFDLYMMNNGSDHDEFMALKTSQVLSNIVNIDQIIYRLRPNIENIDKNISSLDSRSIEIKDILKKISDQQLVIFDKATSIENHLSKIAKFTDLVWEKGLLGLLLGNKKKNVKTK